MYRRLDYVKDREFRYKFINGTMYDTARYKFYSFLLKIIIFDKLQKKFIFINKTDVSKVVLSRTPNIDRED